MTAQPHNRFVFCVVVVESAVHGNEALELHLETSKKLQWIKYLLFGYYDNWPM